jgi:hypothetical protein
MRINQLHQFFLFLKILNITDFWKSWINLISIRSAIPKYLLIQISKSFKILMLLFRYDDSFSKKKEWNHSEYVAKTKPLKVIF